MWFTSTPEVVLVLSQSFKTKTMSEVDINPLTLIEIVTNDNVPYASRVSPCNVFMVDDL